MPSPVFEHWCTLKQILTFLRFLTTSVWDHGTIVHSSPFFTSVQLKIRDVLCTVEFIVCLWRPLDNGETGLSLEVVEAQRKMQMTQCSLSIQAYTDYVWVQQHLECQTEMLHIYIVLATQDVPAEHSGLTTPIYLYKGIGIHRTNLQSYRSKWLLLLNLSRTEHITDSRPFPCSNRRL